MYKLAKELQNLALELNVKIHFDHEVQEIIHKDRSVKALKVNDQIINFDAVISNSDVVYTFEKLIKGFPKLTKKYKKIEPSLSGFIMLLGINKQHKDLVHHNVFFAEDYKKEFQEIFSGKIPNDPTIYLAITSKSDIDHAPDGHENWFILLNMPYLNDEIDWDIEKYKVRDTILNKLNDFGYKIASNIHLEKIFTPLDLYNMHYSNKGSIYGISSNGKMNAFKRPANRNKVINGLYFATGSAHPGGGIPLVVLSGKHAADLINKSYK
jgi:phytoene desaturase